MLAREGAIIVGVQTADPAVARRAAVLEAAGARVVFAPPEPPDGLDGRYDAPDAPASRAARVDLRWLAAWLGGQGINSVLLEGGAGLAAAALRAGVVDRVRFYYAPLIMGGRTAPGPVGGDGAACPDAGLKLEGARWERIGPDMVMEADVCSPEL